MRYCPERGSIFLYGHEGGFGKLELHGSWLSARRAKSERDRRGKPGARPMRDVCG